MEAVSAMLEDGLRVGILFQGRKIRDDNRTLIQTGISHDSRLDALSFTLDPYPSQAVAPVTCEGHPLQPSSVPQSLTKCLLTISAVQQDVLLPLADIPSNNLSLGTAAESDHDSAPSPPEVVEKSTYDSRALVPIPEANVKPLTVIPMQKKSKETEVGQRRIRRPFSVSEVEALVQAVEKLGTGRWRDVKLRAFDNVKHRTYVDLKDKWKTLVHTARISPQQRRGEPVPQELLDRVLAAHAYWSQHQVKQQQQPQLKPPAEACRLLL